MRATSLVLGLTLTACVPAILHRRSTLQARGVCTVETLAHDNPGRAGPRRVVAEYDAAGRMAFHRFQPQYHSEVSVSYRRDSTGRLLAMDFDYRRAAEDFPCGREGGCYSPAVALVGRVEFAYDAAGHITEVVDQRRPGPTRVTRYRYDAQGRRIEGRWGGHVSRYEYAPQGTLPVREHWENSDGGHGVHEFAWDAGGNLTAVTTRGCLSACGEPRTSRYEYDARGHLVRASWYDGTSREWAYDEQGRLVSDRNNRGSSQRWEYDAQGRPTQMHSGERLQHEHSYAGACVAGLNAPEAPRPLSDPRAGEGERDYEPTVF